MENKELKYVIKQSVSSSLRKHTENNLLQQHEHIISDTLFRIIHDVFLGMSSLGMERYPVTTNTKFTQEMKISILGRLKKIEGVQATLDDISKELCTKITAPIPFKKNHPIGNMVKEEGDLFLSLS